MNTIKTAGGVLRKEYVERYQKGSLLKIKRKNGNVVWCFRWYENTGTKRKYCKKIVGTVAELPSRKDAEQAVAVLRVKINAGVTAPETVLEAIEHYRLKELTAERKSFASIENFNGITARHLIPKYGACRLTDIRTVEVEEWLDGLSFAPATKTKIKAIFSVIFSHAIRHQWIATNPIKAVRTSSIRLREKDVLEPLEFSALVAELSPRDRAMIMLAGSAGLRRSEIVGLVWKDIDAERRALAVSRSCFRGRMGRTKTDASRASVPLHDVVLDALLEWRARSPYNTSGDFLFPSIRLNGKKPISPDMVLKSYIKPALKRAGIVDKIIGWHSFRHSLATWLHFMGVEIKVAQELLRHANSRTTMDIYTRAVSSQKRAANDNLLQMIGPQKKAS